MENLPRGERCLLEMVHIVQELKLPLIKQSYNVSDTICTWPNLKLGYLEMSLLYLVIQQAY